MPSEHGNPTQAVREDRVMLPIDPEEARRAVLKATPGDDGSDA
jgi:hypothetical protein